MSSRTLTQRDVEALLDVLENAARCIEMLNVQRGPGAAIIVRGLYAQARRLREPVKSEQVYRRQP